MNERSLLCFGLQKTFFLLANWILSLVVNQWNWDSAIVSAGWAVFDEERGWEELEFLFSDQWADGMVASINFHKFSNTYFPGPEIWGTPEKPSKTTGISQPPVAALAARFMYEHAEQQDLARSKIEELFPKLLAWHRWWYKVNRQHTNKSECTTMSIC